MTAPKKKVFRPTNNLRLFGIIGVLVGMGLSITYSELNIDIGFGKPITGLNLFSLA